MEERGGRIKREGEEEEREKDGGKDVIGITTDSLLVSASYS